MKENGPSSSGRFTLAEGQRYSMNRRLGGLQNQGGCSETTILAPSGISQSSIPISSHYTTTLYYYTVKYEI